MNLRGDDGSAAERAPSTVWRKAVSTVADWLVVGPVAEDPRPAERGERGGSTAGRGGQRPDGDDAQRLLGAA
jgi:hypothetical protein